MTTIKHVLHLLLYSIIFMMVLVNNASAQIDTIPRVDTIPQVKSDTTQKVKEKKKKKDNFILYTGVNFNNLYLSSQSIYESSPELGWQLGFAYKRGNFFYWQLGARYNSAKYNLRVVSGTDTAQTFKVSSLDIPVSAGINFLYFMNRIANIHVFVSAVPSFNLNVPENALGIKKDDVNSFNFYGQAGLGVDIFFLVLEAGFNYGFGDLLKAETSPPGQIFINLGFRF